MCVCGGVSRIVQINFKAVKFEGSNSQSENACLLVFLGACTRVFVALIFSFWEFAFLRLVFIVSNVPLDVQIVSLHAQVPNTFPIKSCFCLWGDPNTFSHVWKYLFFYQQTIASDKNGPFKVKLHRTAFAQLGFLPHWAGGRRMRIKVWYPWSREISLLWYPCGICGHVSYLFGICVVSVVTWGILVVSVWYLWSHAVSLLWYPCGICGHVTYPCVIRVAFVVTWGMFWRWIKVLLQPAALSKFLQMSSKTWKYLSAW